MARYDQFDRFVDEVLPADIDKALLARFRALARRVSLERGQTSIKANGADQIAFIAAGSTKLVAHASGGREQIVGFQFVGDLVCVPSGSAHAFAIIALENGELLQFGADPFFDLAGQQTGLVIAMMERAHLSLAHCREKSITLGRTSAQEKIAGFLLMMADRIGAPDKAGSTLVLPMSRRDIADSLGLSIETVSRQLTILREEALIDLDGRSRVRLSDLRELNARAGNLPINA